MDIEAMASVNCYWAVDTQIDIQFLNAVTNSFSTVEMTHIWDYQAYCVLQQINTHCFPQQPEPDKKADGHGGTSCLPHQLEPGKKADGYYYNYNPSRTPWL